MPPRPNLLILCCFYPKNHGCSNFKFFGRCLVGRREYALLRFQWQESHIQEVSTQLAYSCGGVSIAKTKRKSSFDSCNPYKTKILISWPCPARFPNKNSDGIVSNWQCEVYWITIKCNLQRCLSTGLLFGTI